MAELKIRRELTAIKRYGLSRPLRLVVESGLVKPSDIIFDYGCGHGEDVKILLEKGFQSYGWDPAHDSSNKKRSANIVNLGYVVNVIEDPVERVETLKDAWGLTQEILVVSARLNIESKGYDSTRYQDGYLTRKGTFQKFYTQKELKGWIDESLNVNSIAVAPGVFLVFKDEKLKQTFIVSQYRRVITFPGYRKSDELYGQYRDLLRPLESFIATNGRLPESDELPDAINLEKTFGSIRRAFLIIRRVIGDDDWLKVRESRSQDLLVYLALDRFRGRSPFSVLPRDLQVDIKAFFKSYSNACKMADELLFSAGNVHIVDNACKLSSIGKLTHEALYIHKSALLNLSPELRVYEGCARAYIGDIENANLVKLVRRKSQISYLSYPDFETNPHPPLKGSLVIDLSNLHVKYLDYSNSDNPPILHRKEEFVSEDHSLKGKFARLTKQEERWGLFEDTHLIGTMQNWQNILDERGIYISGHRLMHKKN